jgi:hypothetical protein
MLNPRRVHRSAVLLVLLALGVCASSASAEPLSMAFTEARANVGIQLFDEALFDAPATAPFEAQIDPQSGSITAGVLTVPDFSTVIDEPIDAEVTVEFQIGVIDGSFDQATGALSVTGTAGGTLTADGEECIVAIPEDLTLSTDGSSGGTTNPRSGTPFTAGLIGAGAIAGQWDDMTATPVDPEDIGNANFCSNVEQYIGEDGGIWLEHQGDIVPPAPPQLTSTDPASPSSSGAPRILGVAEAGSTVKVYAGPACGGAPVATRSAAELGSPGIPVDVAEGVTAAFSARAIDAVGNASACSAPISYTRTKAPTGPGGGNVGPTPAPVCVVPKLVGKTLEQAKRALKAAGCKLGKVTKPKQPKGKKRRVLVVKSSSPRRGARPADRKVDLKLHSKPKPKPKKVRR